MSVSVVIPAYNAAATLGRAIESALSQSLPPTEVIVVNDGSSDDTPAVTRRYNGIVRLIDAPHGGVSSARNQGIASSAGEWVAFLDADDEWKPHKLDVQISASRTHPKAALVASGAEAERNGILYKATRFSKSGQLLRDLLADNFITTSSVIVKREALQTAGIRFPTGISFGEDWETWIMIASRYELLVTPDVLVRKFHTELNATAATDANRFGEATASMYDRLRLVPGIDTVIDEMWPALEANIQFRKANYLYDHGDVREARHVLFREVLRSRQMPRLVLAIKILMMPLALRYSINRLIARG